MFRDFFVQSALFIYSKPPNSLLHLNCVKIVECFLDYFKQAARERGAKTLLYDNPYATTLADPEVLKQLNILCQNNPEFQIPEGYKKVNEKHIKESYIIREFVRPGYIVVKKEKEGIVNKREKSNLKVREEKKGKSNKREKSNGREKSNKREKNSKNNLIKIKEKVEKEEKKGFHFSEALKICTELIDGILFASCGTHVIEPIICYYTAPRIIPLHPKPIVSPPGKQRFMLPIQRKLRKLSVSLLQTADVEAQAGYRSETKSVLAIRGGLNEKYCKFTTAMKIKIACAPKEDKENVREVVEVLEDIIEAVELGRDTIKSHQRDFAYSNRALKEKAAKEFEKIFKEKLNEDKRKERATQLKKLIEDNRIELEKKRLKELEQKYILLNEICI